MDDFGGSHAERLSLRFVRDQIHKHKGKFCRTDDANSVLGLEKPDDIAKVFVMIADDDRDSVTRGLDDVVATLWYQAGTHEGDVGKAVNRGEFADRIEQDNASGDRLAIPE